MALLAILASEMLILALLIEPIGFIILASMGPIIIIDSMKGRYYW